MLTDYFIKRPVLAIVISVMMVLLGAQAFFASLREGYSTGALGPEDPLPGFQLFHQ